MWIRNKGFPRQKKSWQNLTPDLPYKKIQKELFFSEHQRSPFFQRGHPNGHQAREKMLNIINYEWSANSNHNEPSPHTCEKGSHQEGKRQRVLVRMW